MTATDRTVALDRIGDAHMKKSTLVIATIAVTAVVAGGWALAQSVGPGGFGTAFMRGQGHGGMGPGMMKGMHGQDHDSMGPAIMKGMGGHGLGMMKGKGPGMRGPEAASGRE
jgi:hypothetical protein